MGMVTVFGLLAPTTAIVVLVIALIVFGPGKLPEIGKALGRGIKEFKDAAEGHPKAPQATQTPTEGQAPQTSTDDSSVPR